MSQLAGRIAMVTGASRGIGLAIAETFAREGATVVICGRKPETIAAAAEGKPGLVPMACHVGRADDIDRLVRETQDRFGRIDILVNNAATNVGQGPCLDNNDSQFDKMIEINLKSAFRFTQRIAPGMCERGRGSIINISSISGVRPQHEGLLYSMTKAALIMMTKSYALELGPHGVRVNAIAPGLIQTSLSEYYWKDETRRDGILARQPIQHLGQPREVGDIALMLASDGSSFLTGQTIVVDGGMLLSW